MMQYVTGGVQGEKKVPLSPCKIKPYEFKRIIYLFIYICVYRYVHHSFCVIRELWACNPLFMRKYTRWFKYDRD